MAPAFSADGTGKSLTIHYRHGINISWKWARSCFLGSNSTENETALPKFRHRFLAFAARLSKRNRGDSKMKLSLVFSQREDCLIAAVIPITGPQLLLNRFWSSSITCIGPVKHSAMSGSWPFCMRHHLCEQAIKHNYDDAQILLSDFFSHQKYGVKVRLALEVTWCNHFTFFCGLSSVFINISGSNNAPLSRVTETFPSRKTLNKISLLWIFLFHNGVRPERLLNSGKFAQPQAWGASAYHLTKNVSFQVKVSQRHFISDSSDN